MLATRYANVALLAGVPVMFGARREWRSAWWVVTARRRDGAVLYAVPVVRGHLVRGAAGRVPGRGVGA